MKRFTPALVVFIAAASALAQSETAPVAPKKQTLKRTITQPAENAEAIRHAAIYGRAAGYVATMHVDIGDVVKAGQALIDLDAPDVVAALAQKEAAKAQADADYVAAQQDALAARAAVESATAKVAEARSAKARVVAEVKRAVSQAERLAKAGASGVIDREAVAESEAGAEAAKASGEEVEAKVASATAFAGEAKAKFNRATAGVSSAKAKVATAAADLDAARATVGFTKLKAPFAGVVTRRNVDVGDLVQPADKAGRDAKPLLVIEDVSKLRVFVPVAEKDAVWISGKGQKATLRSDALGRTFSGVVTRTGFSLDPGTRTLRVEVEVDNAEKALRPGTYLQASIVADRADVWTLPKALVAGGKATMIEDGKATTVGVVTGVEAGGDVEVLGVVVDGARKPITGAERFGIR